MGVGGAPPVAEGCVIGPVGEEAVEVAPYLVEEFLLCVGDGLAGRSRGYFLGEAVEPEAGGLISGALSAVGGVGGESGGPYLVGVSDVVAGFLKNQGVCRYRFVPSGTHEDRSESCLPEVPAGEDRATAWGAAWGGHMGVEEERAFFGDAVEVGGFDEFVDCAFAGLVAVGAGVPAPVVCERENDVWSHSGISL